MDVDKEELIILSGTDPVRENRVTFVIEDEAVVSGQNHQFFKNNLKEMVF